MRVLHVTYQHSADDARILHKQCRTLSESGIDVHLVAPPPAPSDLFGVHFHALSESGSLNKLRRVRQWFREIEAIMAQLTPDIVHLHDPLLLSVVPRYRRHSDARFVYDAHEDHQRQIRALTHLSWPRRNLQAAYYGRLERRAPKHIDLFVAATPGVAKRYPSSRTIVVRNLPRLSVFAPVVSPNNSSSIIYVGGLTRSRGVMQMIDAVAQVQRDDVQLILAGRFDSTATQREAENRPGWARVDYRGWVEHARVPELLHDAAAGLVLLHPKPNYIDAWPVKLFEYMAAGLPFVASDFTPWREMLGGAECGAFVDPLNSRAIASSIEQLLDDRAAAAARGAAGRAMIEREFNWERESETLIASYRALCMRD